VQLLAALLCDFAQVRDGLMVIVATPITRVVRPEYPSPLKLALAVVVEGAPGDIVGLPHEVQVIVSIAGQSVAEARLAFSIGEENVAHLAPGETVNLPLVIDMSELALPTEGPYTILVRLNGGEAVGQPELTLSLLAQQAPTPTQS
jgi:hypothetical protein